MKKALERFLRYASIDTTSSETGSGSPSTPGQWALAKLLRDELAELGANDVLLDENCYVYGRIPATKDGLPVIALIAHMDTADAVPGRDFKPQVKRYKGDDLTLNEEKGIILSARDFPVLSQYQGQELVVTDGTTVLGADDKAGVAEIMTALELLVKHPDIPHGDVWAVFTPDEEIGSGAELLQLDRIAADFAYTVDGGAVNEIEYENFNAANTRVFVKGRNVHPGYAKGLMVNAIKLAMRFHGMLPPAETPELTEGYEGFYHLRHINGTEEEAQMDYLIREHDSALFEQRKQVFSEAAEKLNKEYGAGTFKLDVKDSYFNMKEIILKHPHVLSRATKAIRAAGMEPVSVPIRGGTDGARLSFRGLPCPNMGTGGVNFHSVYEFLPVDSLNKVAEVLVEIVRE